MIFALAVPALVMLAERKRRFDRNDDRNRLPVAGPWLEPPLLRGGDRRFVETVLAIERSNDPHLANGAIGLDDALEENTALHLDAHRLGRVLRPRFADHPRKRHAVARTRRAG